MAFNDKQIVVDGHFVSQRVSQVIHAIQERFPEIVVQWIPPDVRLKGQAAFRIVHFPDGQEPYVIRHVKTEEEFTTAVLLDLIAGDQRNGAVKYSDVEAAEQAAALVAKQRLEDEREEAIDIMQHVFKSPLNTYKVNDNLIIKEGIPHNVAKRR